MHDKKISWFKTSLTLTVATAITASAIAINASEARDRRSIKKRSPRITSFRTIDGSRNNIAHTNWGKASVKLKRRSKANYADGISEPNDADLPNPRTISNSLAAQTTTASNDRNLSDMLWQWGQFLDHDIDLTVEHEPEEAFPISIPAGDPSFDPLNTGTQTLSFHRSQFIQRESRPRNQINSITAYIDGSNVYGSDETRAAALRSFEGGKLKISEGNLLPRNTEGLDNAGGAENPSLYLAGDIRANENVGLLAMHTLFVREHNRKAEEIAAANPELSDEEIYQRTRKFVGALMQKITYDEFLPALLGEKALRPYSGYKRNKNAGIINMFSTAAFRFGHSCISPQILRLDNDGNTIAAGNLELKDAFFRPDHISSENDIDPLLKGLASQQMQEIDNQIIDGLRNFLFGAPGNGGLDLASLNIQRGRDHGLASYNDMRENYKLTRLSSFDQISSAPSISQKLEELYGDINKIEPWVGMLAEDHVSGASVGETMMAVLKFQFERLRDGDRYWYQRTLLGSDLEEVENTSLADVIKRNTTITNIADNVFFVS